MKCTNNFCHKNYAKLLKVIYCYCKLLKNGKAAYRKSENVCTSLELPSDNIQCVSEINAFLQSSNRISECSEN